MAMRFVLEKNLERYFTNGRAILLVNIAIVISLAWVVSLWINLVASGFIRSVPDYKPRKALKVRTYPLTVDYSVISKTNIFNPGAPPAGTIPPGQIEVISAKPTTLNFELLGTILTNYPERNMAVLMEKGTKNQMLYKISDAVTSNAVIVRIDRFAVYIDNAGQMETLFIDIEKGFPPKFKQRSRPSPTGGVREVAAGAMVMNRAYLENQLKDMSKLLVQVRAVPSKNEKGEIEGFKIYSIKKGSLYEKIGLKNHDIIKGVNGRPLNSAEKGLELFSAIKNESHFTVDLVRNNVNTTLTIEIQ